MKQPINRIVVPLDTASETRTAIGTAARLAARWRVPLHGIFIEDEELICLAGLPFACQVTLTTGVEPLTKEHVEDHFQAFAERARREFAAAAERYGVRWSFEVVRGPIAAVVSDADRHDFVVAGAANRPISGHFGVASRWWSSVATVRRPFLLARREWEAGGSVLALLHGRGPEAARALDLASQIADCCGGSLTVAGPSDIIDETDFAAWVAQSVDGQSLTVRTLSATDESSRLQERIVELDCRLVVIEAGAEETPLDELRHGLEQLACDVLIIR